LSTSSCSSGGGTSTPGHCPGTPSNVQCCTKSPCQANLGVCRFTSSCTGQHFSVTGSIFGLATGRCPGPSNFQCCVPCANCLAKREGDALLIPCC
ncbi:hypothetical protein BDQ12DRAFT_613759, partial [Crucibulum laeve]